MNTGTRKRALTEGVIAGLVFGTAAIFVRFLTGFSIFSIVFWRLIIAILALALVAIITVRSIDLKAVKSTIAEIFMLGVFLGLHFIFFTLAVKDTTILNATVLVSTTPFFSMFVSSLVFKTKPSAVALVGFAISFCGMVTIACGEFFVQASSGASVSPSLKGDLEALAAAIIEAFYLNYGRKVRSRMTTLSSMLPIYASAAIVVAVCSIFTFDSVKVLPLKSELLLPLIGLGLLPTALAHTLYFASLSHLKSFETAAMSFLEPLGATILGLAVFGEVPLPVFALGSVLVLAGLFFIVRR